MNLSEICAIGGYKVIKEVQDSWGQICIYLERDCEAGRACRRCGTELSKLVGDYPCRVKHLPVFNIPTLLIFRRVKGFCPSCKKHRSEAVNFVSEQSPHMSKAMVYWLSRLCEITTIKEAAEFCGVDDSTLWRADFAVLKARFTRYEIPDLRSISVDEVSSRKVSHYEGESKNERFFTVITDADTKKIVWVEDSRNKEALDRFFAKIGPEACAKIRVVASDQHPGYGQSIREHCPNARHVLDKFHLMRNFEDAVNNSRKFIAKLLNPKDKKLATGKHRFMFLKRASSRTPKESRHIDQVMKENKLFYHLELIKERMFDFFDRSNNYKEAWKILQEIREWIFDLGAPPLKKWYKTFVKDWDLIKNYFITKVTSSISEGFNNVIKTLRRKAYGFKNMEYFKLKIMQKAGYLNSRYQRLI